MEYGKKMYRVSTQVLDIYRFRERCLERGIQPGPVVIGEAPDMSPISIFFADKRISSSPQPAVSSLCQSSQSSSNGQQKLCYYVNAQESDVYKKRETLMGQGILTTPIVQKTYYYTQ